MASKYDEWNSLNFQEQLNEINMVRAGGRASMPLPQNTVNALIKKGGTEALTPQQFAKSGISTAMVPESAGGPRTDNMVMQSSQNPAQFNQNNPMGLAQSNAGANISPYDAGAMVSATPEAAQFQQNTYGRPAEGTMNPQAAYTGSTVDQNRFNRNTRSLGFGANEMTALPTGNRQSILDNYNQGLANTEAELNAMQPSSSLAGIGGNSYGDAAGIDRNARNIGTSANTFDSIMTAGNVSGDYYGQQSPSLAGSMGSPNTGQGPTVASASAGSTPSAGLQSIPGVENGDYSMPGDTNSTTDWGMKGVGGTMLGAGQLGLGVASYFQQKPVFDKQVQLMDQQIANNKYALSSDKKFKSGLANAFSRHA